MKLCKTRNLHSPGGHHTAGVRWQSVVFQVAYSHRCLDTLADWVRWAMSDRQTTILRLLLAVLLRLPIPPAMVHVGRLLKAVFGLQSYKCAPPRAPPAVIASCMAGQQFAACIFQACLTNMRRCLPCRTPSVCFSAMNLLHHWQQQDPTLWPMPHKKQQLPAPRAAFAASAAQQQQQQQPQPKQTSLHLPTANQAPQGVHTMKKGLHSRPCWHVSESTHPATGLSEVGALVPAVSVQAVPLQPTASAGNLPPCQHSLQQPSPSTVVLQAALGELQAASAFTQSFPCMQSAIEHPAMKLVTRSGESA